MLCATGRESLDHRSPPQSSPIRPIRFYWLGRLGDSAEGRNENPAAVKQIGGQIGGQIG
jgi:hypothetical protein